MMFGRPENPGPLAVCLIVLVLLAAGCASPKAIPAQQSAEARARLASTVYAGDPNSSPQLIGGFYGIEEYSWRWTAQRFAVVLRPPEGATGEAANLVVRLGIPEVVIQKLHRISLTAMVDGAALPPETYTQPGDYTYTREVPANRLTSEEVRVDFQLDRVMPPSGQDIRELGIVVTSIGLEPR